MIILLNFDKGVADEHWFEVLIDRVEFVENSVEVGEDKVAFAGEAGSVAVVEDRIAFDEENVAVAAADDRGAVA